jgi:Domain of unknown function (DUF4129)
MPQNTKHITLLLFLGSLIALILLSASLSNLQPKAGDPFPGASGAGVGVQSIFNSPTSTKTYSLALVKGLFSLIFLILLIYVPIKFIGLITVKRMLQLLFGLFVSLGLVLLISFIRVDGSAYLPGDSLGITPPFSFDVHVTPLGSPPQGLVQFVMIVFVFGAGLLIFKILKLWPHPIRVTDQLLQQAESAVEAIKLGRNLNNVILHCYLQMTDLLKDEQGIERNSNMTVQEFEVWLESKGFPATPVRQLTSLFEKARYGALQTLETDEDTAVDSLNEIIRFCRSKRN